MGRNRAAPAREVMIDKSYNHRKYERMYKRIEVFGDSSCQETFENFYRIILRKLSFPNFLVKIVLSTWYSIRLSHILYNNVYNVIILRINSFVKYLKIQVNHRSCNAVYVINFHAITRGVCAYFFGYYIRARPSILYSRGSKIDGGFSATEGRKGERTEEGESNKLPCQLIKPR